MITPKQREQRRKYIGSSDAAAIMGLDDRRSPGDVWLEKTGRAADFAGNEHTDRGELLEPAVIDWAERELGQKLRRGQMWVHDNGLLAANFDGIATGRRPMIVEAKTSAGDDDWGTEMTDEVPDRVVVQAHHQLAVAGGAGAGFEAVFVPVLIAGVRSFEFRMYRVPADAELVGRVAEAGVQFMEKHVKRDIPPDDFRPHLDVLKRVRRTPKSTIDVDPDLVAAWEVYKRRAKETAQREEETKAAVIAALCECECGLLPDGRRVTFMETQRDGYEVKPTTFRTLRLVAAKASK